MTTPVNSSPAASASVESVYVTPMVFRQRPIVQEEDSPAASPPPPDKDPFLAMPSTGRMILPIPDERYERRAAAGGDSTPLLSQRGLNARIKALRDMLADQNLDLVVEQFSNLYEGMGDLLDCSDQELLEPDNRKLVQHLLTLLPDVISDVERVYARDPENPFQDARAKYLTLRDAAIKLKIYSE